MYDAVKYLKKNIKLITIFKKIDMLVMQIKEKREFFYYIKMFFLIKIRVLISFL